jgi:long-subunit acyl-CoA synthetase (AMP-forming)
MATDEELKLHSTDPKQLVRIIRNSDNELANLEPITIPQLFDKVVNEFPSVTALVQQNLETKEWEEMSYAEYKKQVEKIAKVFIKLGLKRHGTVAILAQNSVEWFVSGMAAIHAG